MKKLLFILLLLPFITFGQNTITVKHTYYTLMYDTLIKSPLISYYIQTKSHAISDVKIDRKLVASFHQDPLIPEKYQIANDKEYYTFNQLHKDDGLRKDKGHLSPYSAFYFDLTAAKESMYYTNTAPQAYFLNEHPWERLEQYILKDLAHKTDNIFVWTGCLYGQEKMNDVYIPDYYWKVVKYNGRVECWLAKNEVTKNTNYGQYSTTLINLKITITRYYPKLKLDF